MSDYKTIIKDILGLDEVTDSISTSSSFVGHITQEQIDASIIASNKELQKQKERNDIETRHRKYMYVII